MEEIELNVVISQESDGEKYVWAAKCLEYKIFAQGETITVVQDRFERSLICQLCLDLMHGREPLVDIARTPNNRVDTLEEGKLVKKKLQYRVPNRIVEKSTIHA